MKAVLVSSGGTLVAAVTGAVRFESGVIIGVGFVEGLASILFFSGEFNNVATLGSEADVIGVMPVAGWIGTTAEVDFLVLLIVLVNV